MRKQNKSFAATILAVSFLVGILFAGYRLLDQRLIAREADRVRSAASAALSPGVQPEDVRRWLEGNGYRVVVWNPHDPRGFVGMQRSTKGEFRIVQGQRRIRRGNWLDPHG